MKDHDPTYNRATHIQFCSDSVQLHKFFIRMCDLPKIFENLDEKETLIRTRLIVRLH